MVIYNKFLTGNGDLYELPSNEKYQFIFKKYDFLTYHKSNIYNVQSNFGTMNYYENIFYAYVHCIKLQNQVMEHLISWKIGAFNLL